MCDIVKPNEITFDELSTRAKYFLLCVTAGKTANRQGSLERQAKNLFGMVGILERQMEFGWH